MTAAKLKLVLAVTLVSVALSVGAGALAVQVWAEKMVPAEPESGPKAAAQKPQTAKPVQHTIREADALPAGAIHRLGSLRFRHDHGDAWWMATAFAHNGKMLATCSASIRIWDPTTGKLLREISNKPQWKTDGVLWTTGSMLFSPDDKVLAAQAEKAIYLLDPASGKLLQRLPGGARLFAFPRTVSCSPPTAPLPMPRPTGTTR